jgi:stage II sporulation protein P
VENNQGEQVRMTTQINGVSTAQLMLVVGTDAGGLTHPNWPENMSLAVKLHAQLEKNSPGICRPISFRSQRFNQDLSPGALIVEVGSAGNTRQEALLAVEQLGQAIIDLANGATSAD